MTLVLSRRAALATLSAAATAALIDPRSAAARPGGPVVVGGKNYTEQLVLAEMTTALLKAKGIQAEKKDGLASALLRQAQEGGEVDVYWEYTGTSLVVYNKIQDRLPPDEAYQRVKALDAQKGLVWLDRAAANSTYAIAMRGEEAAKRGVRTISDLARVLNEDSSLKLATDGEFSRREDGLLGLQREYGFRFPRSGLVVMDPGLTYEALRQGRVDVGVVLATDGRVKAFKFATLSDDKSFFPDYALTPVARKDTLDAQPQLAGLLNDLAKRLSEDTIRSLNAAVDVDGKPVADVAANFLREQGLTT